MRPDTHTQIDAARSNAISKSAFSTKIDKTTRERPEQKGGLIYGHSIKWKFISTHIPENALKLENFKLPCNAFETHGETGRPYITLPD